MMDVVSEWWLAGAGIFVLTACLYVLVWRQQHLNSLERRLQHLQDQVDMFTDSSIQVARAVDRMSKKLPTNPQPVASGSKRAVASRRWVLSQARERMEQGEELLDISAPLGLCRDEVRLLSLRQSV